MKRFLFGLSLVACGNASLDLGPGDRDPSTPAGGDAPADAGVATDARERVPSGTDASPCDLECAPGMRCSIENGRTMCRPEFDLAQRIAFEPHSERFGAALAANDRYLAVVAPERQRTDGWGAVDIFERGEGGAWLFGQVLERAAAGVAFDGDALYVGAQRYEKREGWWTQVGEVAAPYPVHRFGCAVAVTHPFVVVGSLDGLHVFAHDGGSLRYVGSRASGFRVCAFAASARGVLAVADHLNDVRVFFVPLAAHAAKPVGAERELSRSTQNSREQTAIAVDGDRLAVVGPGEGAGEHRLSTYRVVADGSVRPEAIVSSAAAFGLKPHAHLQGGRLDVITYADRGTALAGRSWERDPSGWRELETNTGLVSPVTVDAAVWAGGSLLVGSSSRGYAEAGNVTLYDVAGDPGAYRATATIARHEQCFDSTQTPLRAARDMVVVAGLRTGLNRFERRLSLFERHGALWARKSALLQRVGSMFDAEEFAVTERTIFVPHAWPERTIEVFERDANGGTRARGLLATPFKGPYLARAIDAEGDRMVTSLDPRTIGIFAHRDGRWAFEQSVTPSRGDVPIDRLLIRGDLIAAEYGQGSGGTVVVWRRVGDRYVEIAWLGLHRLGEIVGERVLVWAQRGGGGFELRSYGSEGESRLVRTEAFKKPLPIAPLDPSRFLLGMPDEGTTGRFAVASVTGEVGASYGLEWARGRAGVGTQLAAASTSLFVYAAGSHAGCGELLVYEREGAAPSPR
jgi:hypothetical protein